MTGYQVVPVGWVESSLQDRAQAPRQGAGAPDAWLVFEPEVAEAIRDTFTHTLSPGGASSCRPPAPPRGARAESGSAAPQQGTGNHGAAVTDRAFGAYPPDSMPAEMIRVGWMRTIVSSN